jgi:putative ABC transport system permease protein
MLWRESRGARGRLFFFGACVAVGVAAVVGVAALIDTVELGIRMRSRELLGGDLAVESRTPLPDLVPLLPADLQSPRPAQVALTILPTMVRGERGPSRLAELKAVDRSQGEFPLAGTLTLEPARPLGELLDDHSVLVARALLEDTRLAVGDDLLVGGERFRIRGVIVQEPDPLTFSFAFGPRVLMTEAGLARAKLLGEGQRLKHRTLLRLPGSLSPDRLAEVARALSARIPGGGTYVKVETHADAQPALRNTLDRVNRYLGLVALLSLLIASVGVAQIVSTWLTQATPQTAILRCLGLRPREILWLYLSHVVLLALLGSVVGSIVGATLPALVATAYPELAPPELVHAIPWGAMLRGWAMGVGVALVFSLLPLTAIWQVSPARVLRAEAAPLPVPIGVRIFAASCLLGGVIAAAFAQSSRWREALGFAAGVSLLTVALWLGARGLLWAVGRLPRSRLPPLVWQGAAALARPGAGAVGSIVALGMGSLVVLGITLIQGVLAREIVTALPDDAPSVFLLDIQPDQWPEVERITRAAGGTHIQGVPVVMARLSALDGRTVDQLVKERTPANEKSTENDRERARWVLTREQRVTSLQTLADNNRIVEGQLWHKPGVNEVSLEVDFARDLGAKLGSVLRFDVQGVPVEFEVTSLRTVEWRSFSVNFFLVAEPGTLDDAPQFLLGAARVPPAAEQALQDRLSAFGPNVTILRVQELLARAASLLEQVALAVRLLGGFAAATGLIILAGSVASSQLRRAREAALLKALGLTRARVAALFAVEYALGGAVAGAIAAVGAYGLALGFTRGVLELTSSPSLAVCMAGWGGTIVLSVAAGLLASAHALRVPPLAVFRQQA